MSTDAIKGKLINWLWLPLSLSIFGAYAIQRGLASFAKTDMVAPWFGDSLAIYFKVIAIGMLILGWAMDNVNSRKAILAAAFIGAVGLLTLPYTPWGFGLLFGVAAILVKLVPFSSPMKLFNTNEAVKIAPQSAAKNFGGAFFILFLGAALMTLTWGQVSIMMAVLFFTAGLAAYYIMPDDKIQGWKPRIFLELAKDYMFWVYMVYFFFMSGIYYIVVMGLYPALTKGAGLAKADALFLMAISFLLAGVLRWPSAWLGQKIGHFPLVVAGTVGMALCIPLAEINPVLLVFVFAVVSSVHTPNYWRMCKERWGATNIATVVSLAYTAMYIGAGVFYDKW